MDYTILHGNPSQDLQKRLEKFETQFEYPLGKDLSFSISHKKNYLNFYLSMGKATCIIAQNDQGVQGTACSVIRTLIDPKTQVKQRIAYIGDLKVSPTYQGSRISFKLLKHLMATGYHENLPAMSVVMDGTKYTPNLYTGRVGFPRFDALSKIYILQIQTRHFPSHAIIESSPELGMKLFASIYQKPYFMMHKINLRVKNGGRWLQSNDDACAFLENTLLAKRLFLNNGSEIVNAHLSYLAYRDPEKALNIIKHSLTLANAENYQALFIALSREEYAEMEPYLHQLPSLQISTATVYGTENLKNIHYNINTSEI